MIAVDTSILVYASHRDSPWHDAAGKQLTGLAESGASWAIPWPCVHEFLSIVTNPRIYRPPMPLSDALTQVESWMACPTLHLLGESAGYWPRLRALMESGKVAGGLTHDARIAAICIHHGVDTLRSADRDFSRFRGLKVRNPLTDDR